MLRVSDFAGKWISPSGSVISFILRIRHSGGASPFSVSLGAAKQ